MKDVLFLKPEYIKTLRLLNEWEKLKRYRTDYRSESTEKAFVLQLSRYDGEDKYFMTVYVIPFDFGMFVLYQVSGEYPNVRIVPEVVVREIEETKQKMNLSVLRLPTNVDEIDVLKLIDKEETGIGFTFWAVRMIPHETTTSETFGRLVDDFIYDAEKIKDNISSEYRRC